MKITIVGVGALGSNMLMMLRNTDAEFTIIDMDRVERKNIMAQFHTMMSLGKNKAQALQQALQGLFGIGVKKVITNKLKADNVDALLGGADLIIDCTDNIEVRLVIQGFAKAQGIDCLHGSLSAAGNFGMAMWTEHFAPDAEGEDGAATCEDGAALPFFSFAAAVMAQEVQRFLASGKKNSYQIMPNNVMKLA